MDAAIRYFRIVFTVVVFATSFYYSQLVLVPELFFPVNASQTIQTAQVIPPPPLSSLIGHWKFDEESGTTAADSSGRGNTGTLTSGPTWTTGKFGGAVNFANSTNYISVNDSTSLKPGWNISISAWVYPTAYNPSGYNSGIVYKQGNQQGCCIRPAYGLALNNAGLIVFGVAGDAANVELYSSQKVPLNTWSHVAAVKNGSSVSIYLNGAQVGRGSAGFSALVNTTAPLLIGKSAGGWGPDPFDGRIDDVQIFSTPLTLADIQTLYAGGHVTPALDTTPPTVALSAPSSGTTVQGRTTVSANASDNAGVSQVEFYVDGVLKSTDIAPPYSFAWDTTNGGAHACSGAHTHTLFARAYDSSGNSTASTNVSVNMNDPAYCLSNPPSSAFLNKFVIGQRAKITSAASNVRSTPSNTGPIAGSQSAGAVGTVIGGPTSAGGSTWWRINFDAGADGWLTENLLSRVAINTKQPPPVPAAANVVNIKTAGAKGDGIADDSAAIRNAINSAPNGTRFYFPAGTYRIFDVNINNRSQLQFEGDGRSTVLQWIKPSNRTDGYVFTFRNVSGLVIRNLAFDIRATTIFSGVRFYSVKNVTIQNTRVYDSNKQLPLTNDRWSYLFAQGGTPSEDIWITDNLMQDSAEIEVNNARRVHILRNTIERATWLGINWSSHAKNSVMEDYEISDNTITEPNGVAMTFHSEADGPHTIRGVSITHNQIYMNSAKRSGIFFGLREPFHDTGSIWENISVEDNRIEYAPGPRIGEPFRAINFNRSARYGRFNNVSIRNNTIIANNMFNAPAVTLNSLENSTVSGNILTGVRDGILMTGNFLNTTVTNNSVQATGKAYQFSNSLGGNHISRNVVVGTPLTPWVLSATHATDSIESLKDK